MKVAQNLANLVGKTPIIKLNNIDKNLPGNIYAKCEFMNPVSSIKDRVGLNMINQAIKNNLIDKNSHIIEPTSGNTGIALASYCASLGIKLTIVMPESMSIERQKLMKIFGANLVLTPTSKGMQGSIDEAYKLQKQDKNSIVLQQFENINNPLAHTTTTAIEILDDMDKKIDIFISSVGTGGTISGIGKVLKQSIPNIQIVAVEPKNSAVLSGKKAGIHNIQGIGAGFIPKILDTNIYNQIITVSDQQAIQTAQDIAKKEGLLVGISSGANIYSAIQLASLEQNRDKNIITILCDTGERYLSTELF
jgi:cysteine synthase A